MVILVNNIDVWQNKQEFNCMLELSNIANSNSLIKDEKKIDKETRLFIEKELSNEGKAHATARKKLTTILEYHGVSSYQFDLMKRQDNSGNTFSLLTVDPDSNNKIWSLDDYLTEFYTVDVALSRLDYIYSPTTINYVVDFDSTSLVKALFDTFNSNTDEKTEEYGEYDDYEGPEEETTPDSSEVLKLYLERLFLLRTVTLEMDSLKLYFESGGRNPQTGGKPGKVVGIPAKISEYKGPPLGEILKLKNSHLPWLFENKKFRSNLSNSYGDLPITEVLTMQRGERARNYKSIIVFGFEFSRKRLPIVIGIFLLLNSIGVYIVTAKSRALKMKIIREVLEENVTDMMLDYKWIRFFLWIIVPIFIVFSVSGIGFNPTYANYNTIAIIILIVIILLNTISFIHSLKI